MKRFEAFLGNNWFAWTNTDGVSIKQTGRFVTIKTDPVPATENNPGHDGLVTKFNLDIIPAYTIG